MGYYIETPEPLGKAGQIVAQFGATKIPRPRDFSQIPPTQALICVVNNYHFEAAAFCYDECEFEEFDNPRDLRPKSWLLMDREKAKELTGFRGD